MGNFTTLVEYSVDDSTLIKELKNELIIIATGTQETIPAEYLYGLADNVIGLSQS